MLKNFTSYLQKELRYSDHTLVAYVQDVEDLLEFLCVEEEKLDEITTKDLRRFVMFLMDAGLSPRSVNRKMSSWKKFFAFELMSATIKEDPAQRLKSVKMKKTLPSFVREEDMVRIETITSLCEETFSGQRDRLILELFYQTGIRRSELINIKISDWTNDTLKVLGKRNKERVIPVSRRLTLLKDEYLTVRNTALEAMECEYLILTDRYKKLYPKFVYRKINHYIGEVSTLKKRSPHVLRHTFATHMLNNGARIETIKELLGHESLVTTQIYTHNSFEKLKSIYKQAHPRERKPKN